MSFNFLENDIFLEIFHIHLDIKVYKKISIFLMDILKDFSEHISKNMFPKVVL
jgi:protein associated with RNAse G/E